MRHINRMRKIPQGRNPVLKRKSKPERVHDDPAESKRFIEIAEVLGADKDEGALSRILKRIAPKKKG